MEVRDAKRGQASVEFLIVFSISIVILIFISMLVYQQVVDVGVQKENADMDKVLADLSGAARDVYMQGEGASQTVHIVLPSTYDPAKSGIINNTLLLRTRETSRALGLDFPISGSLPQSPGAHDVILTSRGNSVYVESALFKVNTYLISAVIAPYSSSITTLVITNLANETISVNGTLNWHTPSNISVYALELNFALPAYESKSIVVTVSTDDAGGSQNGYIRFDANSSRLTDSQTVDIYVEVPGNTVINSSENMVVYPLAITNFAAQGQNLSQSVVVCANGPYPIGNIGFSPSGGAPGTWMAGVANITEVAASSCTSKNLVFSVPSNATQGPYTGTVTVAGGGFSQTINVTIYVSNPALNVNPLIWTDLLGPGGYSTMDFVICAQNLNINNVAFTANGSSQDWILGLASMGAIPSGMCAVRTMLISIPTYATPGVYPNTITVSANSGAYSSAINATFTVISQNMTVSPDTWNITMKVGESTSETFMVCSVNVKVVNETFNPSSGTPGSWVGNLSSKGPINPGACILKKLNLTVPAAASVGNYLGNITFSGDKKNNVSVPLLVYAKPQFNNITIQNITRNPTPTYSSSQLTISAFANGSTNSNKTITGCTLMLDNDQQYSMQPSDGNFDSASESIFADLGQIPRGIHTISIYCTDTDEIPSRSANSTFRVYSDILFIYYSSYIDSHETLWVNWLNNQSKWTVDTAYRSNITSGTVDEYSYKAVMMEKWSSNTPSSYRAQLNLFLANDRSVIFVGDALDNAPADFDTAISNGGTDSATSMEILNSTHDITSGFTLNGNYALSTQTQDFGRFSLARGVRLGEISGTNGRTMLAQDGGLFYYGPKEPDHFTGNGSTIATRMIDYALNQSIITQ